MCTIAAAHIAMAALQSVQGQPEPYDPHPQPAAQHRLWCSTPMKLEMRDYFLAYLDEYAPFTIASIWVAVLLQCCCSASMGHDPLSSSLIARLKVPGLS